MKNLKIFIFLLFLLQLSFHTLFAETIKPTEANIKKKQIAILDFNANNTSKSIARIVRNNVELAFFNKGKFSVLERSRIDAILQLKKKQMKKCKTKACATEIGKILDTDYTVIGSVDKLDTYIVTIKVVDIKQNSVIAARTGEFKKLKDLREVILQKAKETAEVTLGERLQNETRKHPFTISIQYNFLLPLGLMGDITKHGHEAAVSFSSQNYLFSHSIFGASLSYINFTGKKNEIKFLHVIPVSVFAGYQFQLSTSFKLEPALGGGVSFISMRYYPYDNEETTKLANEFKPFAFIKLAGLYSINNSFSVALECKLQSMIESGGLLPFLGFGISGRYKL